MTQETPSQVPTPAPAPCSEVPMSAYFKEFLKQDPKLPS